MDNLTIDDNINDNLAEKSDVNSTIPQILISPGIDMIRITRRKQTRRRFTISNNTLSWTSSSLSIDRIQSIRIGDDAKNYREQFNISNQYQNLWISIIYTKPSKSPSLHTDLKILHIITITKSNFNLVYNTLNNLLKNERSLLNHSLYKNRDRLSFNDILQLTNDLQIFINNSYLYSLFEECDVNNSGYLTFPQFQKFVLKLKNRPDLDNIINGQMNIEQFTSFLKNVQHEDSIDPISIFNKFATDNSYMTQNNLNNFLHSNLSPPTLNIPLRESSDYYSRPLTDYFISSSHNTYLLGKQFHGNSSIEGYINALQRGCRCVEIDIWDGESGPIVTHGHTFTTSIDFELVIDIIHKYAFIITPFPLIISLEIKCSPENQQKCLNIMKSIFSDKLITTPINDVSTLPSPNELKHKILLKVKKSKETIILEQTSTSHSSFSTQSDDNSQYLKQQKKFVSSSNYLIIPELSASCPYLTGIKFRNFSLPESKTYNHVFSFSDRSLSNLLRDKIKKNSIIKHNKRGMMRIYPSVVHYKSDNFNPITFWQLGCQMVATNWQIWDIGQQLNEAFFQNFNGYRLKPESLFISENSSLSKELIKIENLNRLEYTINKYFDISIISGQQLPKPKDLSNNDSYTPWVEIEIFNVLPVNGEIVHFSNKTTHETVDETCDEVDIEDEIEKTIVTSTGSIKMKYTDNLSTSPNWNAKFKSRLAENPLNAFSPRWNIACRLNYKTNEHDLSFIKITVKCLKENSTVIDKVNNIVKASNSTITVANWCGKIDDLNHGYRYLKLNDNNGNKLIYSTLFVKITKR